MPDILIILNCSHLGLPIDFKVSPNLYTTLTLKQTARNPASFLKIKDDWDHKM